MAERPKTKVRLLSETKFRKKEFVEFLKQKKLFAEFQRVQRRKKGLISIEREKWKRVGFVSVARDRRSRLITWEKWSPKRPVTRLREIAKQQGGTFKEGFKREELVNVVEVIDMSKKPSRPSKGNYQYFMETIVNKTKITARSPQHDASFPKEKARQEALERLYAKIDQAVTGGYDEDDGRKIAEQRKLKIREGIVHYVKK